MKEEI